jgi:hypothetical protein
MQKKHWVWFILLAALFPLGEFYMVFDKTIITPWIDRSFNYPVSWRYYIDNLGDVICPVVFFSILLRCVEFKRVWPLKFIGRMLLAYSYYDLFMYLMNHNYYTSYVFGYSCMIVLAAIMYLVDGAIVKLKGLQESFKDKIEIKEAYQ